MWVVGPNVNSKTTNHLEGNIGDFPNPWASRFVKLEKIIKFINFTAKILFTVLHITKKEME